MFSNLQIRPARSHRRKPSLTTRAGVSKRRVSTVSASTASNVPSLSLMEDLFGDEFPEAFASSSVRGRANRKTLLDLPSELLSLICEDLSKLDIKRLRLANQHLANNVDLRIDRVYISPNRANLDCLQWVLQHPRHGNRVREIVWDDAQLDEYPNLESFRRSIDADDLQWTRTIEDRLESSTQGHTHSDLDYEPLEREDFFHQDGRLSDSAKNILLRYNDRFSRMALARNALMMSIDDSYVLYSRLYQEEQDMMKRGVDVVALNQALQSLSNVRRITLTSEVWRPWHFLPRYDTPSIRSLPTGFRKPTVWPWLGDRPYSNSAEEEHGIGTLSTRRYNSPPNDWRGYTIITSALLSQTKANIEEFIIDAGNEPIGISQKLFIQPNEELERTIQLFRNNTLRRLQTVISETPELNDRRFFTGFANHYIKTALVELRHLTHLDLRCGGTLMAVYSRETILPPHLPAQLRIFALRNFLAVEPYLTDHLRQMTKAHQITLEDIVLCPDDDANSMVESANPEHMFHILRDYYTQHEHDASISQPNYTWIEPSSSKEYFSRRCRMVHEEINDFLYGGWDCPFRQSVIEENVGWVIDRRDPDYKERAATVMQRSRAEGDAMGFDNWLPTHPW
ncbi:hypothetical protein T440DRAFT_164165 [Plenodomus tracheiphilus IPT5]|uniref:F-box domain-containing protein n=1 Tax=Plenodomus tracheiphilus IPT5 TaxID=1408161 RepID=A0A6A7BKX5_9PLEO|nr:hypothetical protein T440DRAFT_164165 [Plenodomus tracheiphilus IPT5]